MNEIPYDLKPGLGSSDTIYRLSTYLPPGSMDKIISDQARVDEQVKKVMLPCISDIIKVPILYDAGGQTRTGAINSQFQSRYSNRSVDGMLAGLGSNYLRYTPQESKLQKTSCGGCPTYH